MSTCQGGEHTLRDLDEETHFEEMLALGGHVEGRGLGDVMRLILVRTVEQEKLCHDGPAPLNLTRAESRKRSENKTKQ